MLPELSTKTTTLYTSQVNVKLQNVDRFLANRSYCTLFRHDTRHWLDRMNFNMRLYQSYFNISRTSTSVVLQHRSYFNISHTSTSIILQYQLYFNINYAKLKHSYYSSIIGVQHISPASYTAPPRRCHEDN